MPKIKIKEFKGIYSNVDENDLRLDIFKDSVNFRHEQGYAEFEPSFLESIALPTLTEDWSWETGVFTILSNDALNQVPVPDKWEILFLVAKKYEGGVYYRRFYYKEWSNSSWIRLSKEGTSSIDISESFFQTTKSGRTFFREDQGKLKIFLPHDCFWFGKIERTYYGGAFGFAGTETRNLFYLDRLVEPFDKDNLGYTNSGNGYLCASNRRLGHVYTTRLEDESTIVVEPEEVEFLYLGTVNDWNENRHAQYAKFKIRNKKTGQFYQRSEPAYRYQFNLKNTTSSYDWVLPSDSTIHIFPYQRTTLNLLIPEIYNTLYMLKGGTILHNGPWGALINKPIVLLPTNHNWSGDPQFEFYDPANSYSVPLATLIGENTSPGFVLRQARTVGTQGFDKTTKDKYYIIITQVLDEKTEVIVGVTNGQYTGNNSKYVIKFAYATNPKDTNRRITRTRYYISFNIEDDYELAHEIEYLNTETIDSTVFYISELSLNTGIMLSQNIGFTFDWDKKESYSIIAGFRDFVIENGLSLGLSSNDFINVYHCVIGGGNIQTDLLYNTNLLPLPNVTNIEALIGTNGNILAISQEKTYVIKTSDLNNIIGYAIIETLEYGVRNTDCVASTGNKTILSTFSGIFLTDGFNVTSISKPIDNIIRENYFTSQIVYNLYLHELYFIPNVTNSSAYFRFRFLEEKWEKRNLTANNLISFNRLFVNSAGKIALLSIDTPNLYLEGTLNPNYYNGYLQSNNSDLSEPNIDKLINYLEIDFQGKLEISIYTDEDLVHTFSTDTSLVRTTNFLYMPLSVRKTFQKVKLLIQTITANTKLYGLEIDFSILKKRR